MLKNWIAWLFKIPRIFVIRYRDGDKKVLIISKAIRGNRAEVKRFLVEHSVNEKLEFTSEMLIQENEDFPLISK